MPSDAYWRLFYRDWDDGVASLSLEEEAALLKICNVIASRRGPIEDDPGSDREMSARCRVSVRKWKSLKASLVEKRKIKIEGGLIYQNRALAELGYRQMKAENGSKNGSKNSENDPKKDRKCSENEDGSNKNNEFDEAKPKSDPKSDPLNPLSSPEGTGSLFGDEEPPEDDPPPDLDDLVPQAVQIYRDMCSSQGLPDVVSVSDTRKKQVKARLKDYGLDGWTVACHNVSRSNFLLGKEGRDSWTGAAFDWFIKAGNFQKIIEGTYRFDRADPFPQGPSGPPRQEDGRSKMAEMGIII